MMTLRQIRHFIAVAETGSISAAAQTAFISRSTLTLAIQQLEEEIGVSLFSRHAKGMTLTHQGHQFLRQAHLILATVDNAKRSLQQSTDQVAGQLIVGVPDMQAVINGTDKDPVTTILNNAFGPIGSKVVMGVVMISFISCVISLQAAASRLLYSYARDEMVIGSRLLKKISPTTQVPVAALFVSGVLPALIIALGFFLQDAVATIVSFAAIGIYLAFQMIVLAALYARSKGWKPSGKFTLGAWGWPVNIGALVYGVGAIINMAWPRTPDAAWYVNYAMVLSTAIVIGLGLVYMWIGKPYDHGKAPAGDAWKVSR